MRRRPLSAQIAFRARVPSHSPRALGVRQFPSPGPHLNTHLFEPFIPQPETAPPKKPIRGPLKTSPHWSPGWQMNLPQAASPTRATSRLSAPQSAEVCKAPNPVVGLSSPILPVPHGGLEK